MNQYNITAIVYKTGDTTKQTLLVNQVIDANSSEEASKRFNWDASPEFHVVKIYSIEPVL